MVKVLVNGAAGRMGQEVVKAVEADSDLTLVGTSGLGDDLAKSIIKHSPDVVVDFTTASSGFENTKIIINAGVRPVIGTSGFAQDQVKKLQELSAKQKIGGVIAPNFAIGAVLMMKFAQEASKYLPHVEIVELHHDEKADAPSGTAVRTAELIAEARKKPIKKVQEKELLPGARGASIDEIPIHSIRVPGLIAQQLLVFGGLGQTLKIEHNSSDRKSFMPGVCLACKKVMETNQLYYGLEHLL